MMNNGYIMANSREECKINHGQRYIGIWVWINTY